MPHPRLGRGEPLFLSSTVKEDNAILAVDLTNPDIREGDRVTVPRGTLHLFRGIFLWEGVCYQRLRLRNYGPARVEVVLLAPVRRGLRGHLRGAGQQRARAAARALPPLVSGRHGRARVRGARPRRPPLPTRVLPAPEPAHARPMPISLALDPQRGGGLLPDRLVRDRRRGPPARPGLRCGASARATESLQALQEHGAATIYTSNEQFNDWVNRSLADLDMMVTRDPARAVSLRRGAVVQHPVRPRRDHHRASDALDQPGHRPRRAQLPRSHPGRRRRSPSRTPSRARSCTRPAAARWPRSARSRSAGTTAASIPPRCSCCWPAPTTSGRPTGDSPSRSGRTSSAPSTGSITTAIATATGSSSTTAPLPRGWRSKGGRTRTTRCSTPTANWPAGRSRCARCRGTSTPPSAAQRDWPSRSARLDVADRLTREAELLRKAIRGRVLVRGTRHLRPGPRRREAPVPGAVIQPRPLPVHGHRRAGTGRARGRDASRHAVVLRLGRPHGGRRGGPLQPDVVPQRLGLAARQRAHRRGAGALSA